MSETINGELAEQIARLAITEYKKAEEKSRKERHNRNLRNTKKLMRIMPTLVEHSTSSISELSDVCDDDALDIILGMMKASAGDGDVHVESIRRSKARTRIMIDHIFQMVEAFRQESLKSKRDEVQRRFRVLEMMYLAENRLDADEIAEIEKIDRRTVYKDIDAACERLSYFIFGVDAF